MTPKYCSRHGILYAPADPENVRFECPECGESESGSGKEDNEEA